MTAIPRLGFSIILGVATLAVTAIPAIADGGLCLKNLGTCEVKATKPAQPAERSSSGPRRTTGTNNSRSSGSNSASGSSGETADQTKRRLLAAFDRDMAAYERGVAAYDRCVAGGTAGCSAPVMPGLPAYATAPPAPADQPAGQPAQPIITPAQAGAIAVARLQLPLNAPKIGPDPKVNQWKMAAVGYPLWLWTDGPTTIGPVGQSVAGLSVSLRADRTRTSFRMGDGTSVRCAGSGTPYRSSVNPGTPSPTCGHRYEKASLPRGNYTVTAVSSWSVTWSAGGQSGVIVVPRAASTELPVGELQSLVR